MTTTENTKHTLMQTVKLSVPILAWLPAYQKQWLRGDVIAALTLWALLVPEAMAYAGIAGMPPETGLTLPHLRSSPMPSSVPIAVSMLAQVRPLLLYHLA